MNEDAHELLVGAQDELPKLRAACAQLSAEIAELRPDFLHVDRRLRRLLIAQLATLATFVASLVVAGFVNEREIAIRNFLYQHFADTAQTPRVTHVVDEFGLSREEAEAAFRRLHDAHALVLEHNTLEIRMLNPFSCVPSAWRVHAKGRTWYSNCAWDSFAVCAALQTDGRVEASCADCGEPIVVEVRDREAVPDEHLFHVLVPARQWWDDIVFT